MPSAAVTITGCGSTSCVAGYEPVGMVSAIARASPAALATTTCGGSDQSEWSAAVCPSLVITGCHVMPALVTADGFAEPSTGADQTRRRSMSS